MVGALGGVPLSPKPRRSVATTVWRSARRGATRCHIRWVWGMPCNSSTGEPWPPRRPWIVVAPVAMSNSSNPSNTKLAPCSFPVDAARGRAMPRGRPLGGLRLPPARLRLSSAWPIAPQPGADLVAIHAWHHRVEQDEAGLQVEGLGERFPAVVDGDRVKALQAQVERNEADDVRVVVGDQHDVAHGLSVSAAQRNTAAGVRPATFRRPAGPPGYGAASGNSLTEAATMQQPGPVLHIRRASGLAARPTARVGAPPARHRETSPLRRSVPRGVARPARGSWLPGSGGAHRASS
jgi:hypothetical protein